ncbi:MAG: hypothetical protein ABJH06_07215 [Paraglaciecola sp.]|uniref:hypothetical protein n=1 Tax=Paraglaciecola sp. TaxID=1920173 RepID=UPI003298F3C8
MQNLLKPKKKLILNCSKLNQKQVDLWLELLSWFKESVKLQFDVFLLSIEKDNCKAVSDDFFIIDVYQIDFSQSTAFLFDSKTFTENLLVQFDTLHLLPQREPSFINHLFFPLMKNDGFSIKRNLKPWHPICCLITSMFNGDEYKTGFLENTANFIQLEDIENIVFRPDSKGKEHLDLMDFGSQNTSLIYIWLAADPGLYDVWNLGVRLSSSPFCSNANIDDKRSPKHVVELVDVLTKNQEVDAASASLRVTDVKNQPWNDSNHNEVWYKPKAPEVYGIEKLAKFNHKSQKIVSQNTPHCMPVWRTKLHRENGYFTENRFGPSSDWEFWLRCGASDSKFYLLNEEFGLYYRAPGSYWRRNPKAKNFDDSIVNEYFAGRSKRSIPLSQNLKSLQLTSIVSAFKQNDFWVGFGLIYKFLKKEFIQYQSHKDLLEALCKSILKIDLQYLINCTNRLLPVSNLRDTFFDFIGFYLRGLNQQDITENLFAHLLILSDKIISSDDVILGLIIKAKIHQQKGESHLESIYLNNTYSTDRYKFWCNINRIYGLEESLPYYLERLDEAPQISDFSWLTPGRTLYFLPDYSHGNPYQSLLYQNFKQLGVEAKGLSESDSINLNLSQFESGDVLHIHWINVFFNNQTTDTLHVVLEDVLSKLRLLKKKGVKVVWTVHNRQNHEQLNLDIEYNFRNELSKLCDVVLLHHPLIEIEIKDWLDENANVQIVEHGLYQDTYKNDIVRADARKKIGINDEKLTIATLGKIKEYKDLVPKVQVFKKAILDNRFSANFLIAGKIFCKKTLAEIKSFKNDSVKVVNKFIDDDEVQLYLNSADYVLLSYRDILTSGGFFQAMSFSKRVLAPSLGTLNYYVVDGINGYKYCSDEELSNILVSLEFNYETFSITDNLGSWPILSSDMISH